MSEVSALRFERVDRIAHDYKTYCGIYRCYGFTGSTDNTAVKSVLLLYYYNSTTFSVSILLHNENDECHTFWFMTV